MYFHVFSNEHVPSPQDLAANSYFVYVQRKLFPKIFIVNPTVSMLDFDQGSHFSVKL